MAGPIAKLGDANLDARNGVSWAIREGVTPNIAAYTLDREEAEKLLRGLGDAKDAATDGDVSLRMSMAVNGKRREVEVKGLRVLGKAGTTDIFSETVLVADQRWKWNRKWVRRSFNLRRRSGDRRRLDEDGDLPAATAPTVDDVDYLEATLQEKGKPWTALEMAKEVLDEVIGQGNWTGQLNQFTKVKPVDNVEIDAPGHSAVAQVLGFLTGAAIYVGLDGKAVVKNALDEAASDKVMARSDYGEKIVGGGEPRFVSLRRQRPSSIEVLFDVEQEVRFDYFSGRSSTDFGEARYMENVLPVPDASLKIVQGRLAGKTVVRGTWVSIPDVLASWNADKGGDFPDITEDLIRKWYNSDRLEANFIQYGTPDAVTINWPARIAAVRAHYWQSFRVSRKWMNRVYSMSGYRATIEDSETGSRSPAVAYMDYSLLFSSKGLRATSLSKQGIGKAVQGGRLPSQPLAGGTIAPAYVTIEDAEVGIIRVDLQRDLSGNVESITPGLINALPRVLPLGNAFPVTKNGSRYGNNGSITEISSAFQFSTVVTCSPVSPNNTRRLYSENVTLSEAQDYLPNSIKVALGAAEGPVWQARVGHGILTARFPWIHDQAADIERSFGVGLPLGAAAPNIFGEDFIFNPFAVKDMARVIAAGIYASMPDHWEGNKRIPLSPEVLPTGRISSVVHSVGQGGAFTDVSSPDVDRQIDTNTLLPRHVQNLVQRLVKLEPAE